MTRLQFFVPGVLKNPNNGNQGRPWQAVNRERKEWRTRTHAALLATGWRPREDWEARLVPKRVRFQAHTWNTMDDDGLTASLKSVRDELVAVGLLSGDAPADGNVFVYAQCIDRKRRGVEVIIDAL